MDTIVNSPAVNIPAPLPAQKKRRRYSSASYLRLERTLPIRQQEFTYLSARSAALRAGDAPPKADGSWVASARALLDQAQQSLMDDNAELGWRCLNEASSYLIYGMAECDPEMLSTYATSLYKESLMKLTGWRKDTVASLLTKDGKFDPAVKVDNVVTASRLLDEAQNSVFENMALFERRLTFLTIATVIGLLAWISISDMAGVPRNVNWQANRWIFWTMISVIGFMGSILSMFVSVVREQAATRLPETISSLRVTVARMAIAPLAAVLAVILLSSGIINLGTVTLELTIVVAIVAGFSEQLVVHALHQFLSPGDNGKSTTNRKGETITE